MLEFCTSTEPRARKEHKCDLCRRVILAGTKYVRCSGKLDGYFFDTKLHTECQEIIDDYCSYYGENEWDEDGVFYWIQLNLCDSCSERDECEKSVIDCYLALKKGVVR